MKYQKLLFHLADLKTADMYKMYTDKKIESYVKRNGLPRSESLFMVEKRALRQLGFRDDAHDLFDEMIDMQLGLINICETTDQSGDVLDSRVGFSSIKGEWLAKFELEYD